MRKIAIAFALLVSAEGAALACQCEDPATMSEKDMEQGARWMADAKMIIAEVERMERPDVTKPDVYRVIRPIIGSAPQEIRVGPRFTRLADGTVVQGPITSCDYAAPVGVRRIMAFMPNPPHAPGTALPCGVFGRLADDAQLAPASMCAQSALEAKGMIDRIRRILAEPNTP